MNPLNIIIYVCIDVNVNYYANVPVNTATASGRRTVAP